VLLQPTYCVSGINTPTTHLLGKPQGTSTLNVSSKLRGRAPAVAHPRTSLSVPRTFIGLVYSQFELIKVQLRKVNYTFCYFLGAYKCYGPFLKIAAPLRVAQANPIAAQKTQWHPRLRRNVVNTH
jgi:hypothetical protein